MPGYGVAAAQPAMQNQEEAVAEDPSQQDPARHKWDTWFDAHAAGFISFDVDFDVS